LSALLSSTIFAYAALGYVSYDTLQIRSFGDIEQNRMILSLSSNLKKTEASV